MYSFVFKRCTCVAFAGRKPVFKDFRTNEQSSILGKDCVLGFWLWKKLTAPLANAAPWELHSLLAFFLHPLLLSPGITQKILQKHTWSLGSSTRVPATLPYHLEQCGGIIEQLSQPESAQHQDTCYPLSIAMNITSHTLTCELLGFVFSAYFAFSLFGVCCFVSETYFM